MTYHEDRCIDLVHEYLQQIPEQQNLAKYSRVVDNMWYDLALQQTVGRNGFTQSQNGIHVEWTSLLTNSSTDQPVGSTPQTATPHQPPLINL